MLNQPYILAIAGSNSPGKYHFIPLKIPCLSQLAGEITLYKVGESPFSRGEQAANHQR